MTDRGGTRWVLRLVWAAGLASHMACAGNGASAQGDEPGDNAVSAIDFDAAPDTRHEIAPGLRVGARLELDTKMKRNFDLDSSSRDNETSTEPQLKTALSYVPNPRVSGFLELALAKRFFLNHPDGTRSDDTKLRVRQLYVLFPRLSRGAGLQVGRQRFKDPREWWYDAKLDSARLLYGHGPFGLEASVSRKQIVGDDFLNDERTEDVGYLMLVGHYRPGADTALDLYAIARNDREPDSDEDPVFIGLQTTGKLRSTIKYWLDAAHVRGSDTGNNIRAWGFDLGATYRFKVPFRPYVTLDVAFGSGDADPDRNGDGNFRQTGLQDNNAKFRGVTRFRYYGELLRPELSNMWILTSGLGIRPTKKSSIDLVYHYYRQHRAVDELRDADLDVDPDGEHRDLGQELDIVMGHRGFRNLKLEFVLGAFFPGEAFPGDAKNAYLGKLEFSYHF